MKLTYVLMNLLLLMAVAAPTTFVKRHTPFLPGDYWKGQRPDFGPTDTELEVMENGTARFKCPISHVADSSISFIRRRDFHILSNGHQLYTADRRFEIFHGAKSHDWILILRKAQLNDSGVYECQISTTMRSHSLSFNLNVVMPRAKIMVPNLPGPQNEVHVVKGSTISLVCLLELSSTPPQFVFWYLNDGLVNLEDQKTTKSSAIGVTVDTITNPELRSVLTIQDAKPGHAGNYTCQPTSATAASVLVFVSEDRQSEALLRKESKNGPSSGELPIVTDAMNSASIMNSTEGLLLQLLLHLLLSRLRFIVRYMQSH